MTEGLFMFARTIHDGEVSLAVNSCAQALFIPVCHEKRLLDTPSHQPKVIASYSGSDNSYTAITKKVHCENNILFCQSHVSRDPSPLTHPPIRLLKLLQFLPEVKRIFYLLHNSFTS